MTLKEDLKTLLNTKKHTITSVAKAINVSNATLHLWLNDNYKGNVKKVDDAVKNFLEIAKLREGRVQIEFVKTSVVDDVFDIARTCHIENEIGVCYGVAGIGKTFAVKRYAIENTDVKNKNYIQITEKKTGKFKRFPINSKLKPMFDEFTKDRKVEEPLFVTIFGNRLERVASYYIIRTACEKAGIETKVGTHTMRKTFGYHHYKKFKDVAMLQKIFNHSSPQITLRYIGIEQDQIDESYNNFIL